MPKISLYNGNTVMSISGCPNETYLLIYFLISLMLQSMGSLRVRHD